MKKRIIVLSIIILIAMSFSVCGTGLNLITNGDFETLNTSNWFSGYVLNKGVASVENVNVYEGNYSLKMGYLELLPGESSIQSYVNLSISGVTSGATYKMSSYIMVDDCYAFYTFSFYNSSNTFLDSINSTYTYDTNGLWTLEENEFTVPYGTSRIYMYIRARNAGYAYFDNLYLEKIAEPPMISIEADDFLYSQQSSYQVKVIANTEAYTIPSGSYVNVYVKDGNDVIASQQNLPITTDVTCSFDISAFPLTGTPYQIVATINNGNEVSAEVYKYNRPSIFNDNGQCVINNEFFVPVFGYHVYNEAMMTSAKATGVNIIQGTGTTAETVLTCLDSAQNQGIMVVVPLYMRNLDDNIRPAAHEQNIQRTISIVNAAKNHPALFGYIVMDEPFTQGTDTFDETIKLLKDSYKLVRDLDLVHPILIQESSGGSYYQSTKYCDALIMHSYPVTSTNTQGIKVAYQHAQEAVDVCNGTPIRKRPVYFLAQSFGDDTLGAVGYILPTIEQVQETLLWGAMAGVSGLGYYSFQETGWKLTDKSLYTDMVQFAQDKLPNLINENILKNTSVVNGDFEWIVNDTINKPINWDIGVNASFEVSEDASNGWYSIKLKSAENSETYRLNNTITGLTSGNWYEVSIWAKQTGTGTGYSNLYVFPSTGSVSVSNKLAKTNDFISSEWSKYTCRFKVPAGQTSVRFQLVSVRYSDTQYVLCDNIKIKELSTGVDFFNSDGNLISNFSEGDNVTVSYTLINNDSEINIGKTCILAYFEILNGVKKLNSVYSKEIVAEYGNVATEFIDLTVPDFAEGTLYEIKAFIWDSFVNLEAAFETVSVTTI